MNTIDYTLLLERLYPTSNFGGSCTTYDLISWKDTAIPKPSKAELAAAWVLVSLDLTREAKLLELSLACEVNIESGFYSTALGTAHFYKSARDDQLNLIGVVSLGLDVYYTCTSETTKVTQPTLHTSAEIKQVMLDGKNYKQSIFIAYYTLKAQVLAATTEQEVLSYVWKEIPS